MDSESEEDAEHYSSSSPSTPSTVPLDRKSELDSPVSRNEYTGTIAHNAEMKHMAEKEDDKPMKVRHKFFCEVKNFFSRC